MAEVQAPEDRICRGCGQPESTHGAKVMVEMWAHSIDPDKTRQQVTQTLMKELGTGRAAKIGWRLARSTESE